jgi:hypothetical protein
MSDGKIEQHETGLLSWEVLTEDLGELLAQLLAAPAALLDEHSCIPEEPGVALYSKGDRAILVEHATDLKAQLDADNRPEGSLELSRLAFLLGRGAAMGEALIDDPQAERLSRLQLEDKPQLARHFERAREEAPLLPVRFLPVEDYLEGRVLAMYAEVTLPARIFNASRRT